MHESSSFALAWLWDNDPELREIADTPYGDARLLVDVAAPWRWPGLKLTEKDRDRAARAIEHDSDYRAQVYDAAIRRLYHVPGAHLALGERAEAAHRRLVAAEG